MIGNIRRCCAACVCANYSAMSVSMLLAPAHYYRLSCAQWRRHTSVWSDTRSVQSPNDAALRVLHGETDPCSPLINVNILTRVNVNTWTMWNIKCGRALHMFNFSGFKLSCFVLVSPVSDFQSKIKIIIVIIIILFSSTYNSPGSCLHRHTQTHTHNGAAGESQGNLATTSQWLWLYAIM